MNIDNSSSSTNPSCNHAGKLSSVSCPFFKKLEKSLNHKAPTRHLKKNCPSIPPPLPTNKHPQFQPYTLQLTLPYTFIIPRVPSIGWALSRHHFYYYHLPLIFLYFIAPLSSSQHQNTYTTSINHHSSRWRTHVVENRLTICIMVCTRHTQPRHLQKCEKQVVDVLSSHT